MPGSCWSTAGSTSSCTTSQLVWPVMGSTGNGEDRNLAKIARCDQDVERLGTFLLVESILGDDRTQRAEIRAQDGFASLHDGLIVERNCDRHQDHDNADDDHQLQ